MKKSFLTPVLLLFFAFFASCSRTEDVKPTQDQAVASENSKRGIYKNQLDFVLGDVKQILINNQLSTNAQADNLLKGFKTMKVNGIRFPIYPKGKNPNTAMYNYLFNQAVAQGFKIFANPALTSGGKRVANGSLTDESSVLNNSAKTQALIDRIKEFAVGNKCTWICPLNEDGAPGKSWSTGQMNTIFSSLKGNMNGAQLVGPCTWGIPAGTEVLTQTNVKNYISIATTHNLGYDHSAWTAFKNAAGTLPKWDSETNYNTSHPNPVTRLQAAINANVNGLVLYSSSDYINLSNGSVNATGNTVMSLYLN